MFGCKNTHVCTTHSLEWETYRWIELVGVRVDRWSPVDMLMRDNYDLGVHCHVLQMFVCPQSLCVCVAGVSTWVFPIFCTLNFPVALWNVYVCSLCVCVCYIKLAS